MYAWVVGLYLCGLIVVSALLARRVKSGEDFMVAGRGLKTYLAIATMIGTELGLVTVMYSSRTGH